MIISWLLFFAICMSAILLAIHDNDEIHQLMGWLSGLVALACILILTPPLIKGLLGIFLFNIGHKIFPIHNSFR